MKNESLSVSPTGLEAIQARFALRVAGHLNQATRELPHDVTERLKAAREMALEQARLARRAEAASGQRNGSGSLATMVLGGGSGSSHWFKLASLLPIVALVAGFVMIDRLHVQAQIAAAAEIDAALLADDLPPTAYTDPGFVEFLKVPHD
jgi:hypothetical protein